MHVIDLRGVIAIAAGSIVKELMNTRAVLGASQPVRLAAINRAMRKYHEDHNTLHRMPDFRKDDLTLANGWWCLHGKLVKAANSRALVPFLNHLQS